MEHAPKNAMDDPAEIALFHERCSDLMRELLAALATAPDRPRTFPEIEDAMGWPRRRIASVLGGVSHLRHTEFGGRRPYRFHDARQAASGRWELWMDGVQADAVRAAQRDEFVDQVVPLPGGELRVLQPAEAAELPDDGEVEWAPVAPYWAVLWRSGVALARELDGARLRGRRVVELGCGLAVPSIAAARAGATVLATDSSPEALELVARNARANRVSIETAVVDWAHPDGLVERGPFDLALAADVLYEAASGPLLMSLLPRLAAEVWLADPGRATAAPFLEEAVETRVRGVVRIHRLKFGCGALAS